MALDSWALLGTGNRNHNRKESEGKKAISLTELKFICWVRAEVCSGILLSFSQTSLSYFC